MSNYQILKSAIQQVVKTNGNNEITGALLQQSLLAMVNSLGAEYQFAGVATPTTNPGTPDQKVVYIANGKGVYANFGGITITEGGLSFLYWDSSWHVVTSATTPSEDFFRLESLIHKTALKMMGQYNYIDLSQEYADIENPVISLNLDWKYAVVDVDEGDVVTVNGYGGVSSRLWAMLDADNKIIKRADANLNDSVELYIPAGIKKVVINSRTDETSYLEKQSSLTKIINMIGIRDDYPREVVEKIINTQGHFQGSGRTGFLCPVTPGECFYIENILPDTTTRYAYLSSYSEDDAEPNYVDNTKFVNLAYGENNLIVIPDGCAFLFINKTGATTSVEPLVAKLTASFNIVAKIYQKLEELTPGQFNLLERFVGRDDQIWSWWNYPQVIETNFPRKSLIWGFTDSVGNSGVGMYNFSDGMSKKTILKKNDIDDHNACTIYQLPDGRIAAIYADGHNTGNNLYVRISRSIGNIDEFNDAIIIPFPTWISYAQVFYKGGKYYMFTRIGTTTWGYVTSEDFENWSTPTVLIDGTMQYYCKFVDVEGEENKVRVVMYSNPSMSDNAIRMGFIDFSTGHVFNSDGITIVGNIDNTIPYSNFNILVERYGTSQRFLDVAITPMNKVVIIYARWNDAYDAVYYCYDNGNVTPITTAGESFWHPKYQGGVSFAGSKDRIVLSKGDGGNDYIEIWGKNAEWEKLKEIYSHDKDNYIRNIRPIAVTSGKYILWQGGYYEPSHFTSFCTDAFIYDVDNDIIIK